MELINGHCHGFLQYSFNLQSSNMNTGRMVVSMLYFVRVKLQRDGAIAVSVDKWMVPDHT
jgi:hypothetical protein